MAYKPYKINKGTRYQYNNGSKYDIARMKLFGFRSGIAWKMIPALFYYAIAAMIIISSILGEVREFQFEGIDIMLDILKYVFIFIVLFSPAIFLSDFKYNEKIPFFKNKSVGSSVLGLTIVILVSVFLIWTYQYCMSDTYKESADAYYTGTADLEQQ